MTDDDLPSPETVVREAIENRTSVRSIVRQYARTQKEDDRLTMRVYRYLKRTPGGERMKEYLLKTRSWYRLNAAARLVASALIREDTDPISDLIADGGVPIVCLSRSVPDERKTYLYWYTQVTRQRPDAIDYVRADEAPALSIRHQETPNSAASSRYFEISDHEFGTVT